MASFKAGGRSWKIHLNIGLLGTIKRDAGIDLAGMLASGEKFAAIVTCDPEILGQILFLVCESEIAAAGLSPEQFASGIDGDALDEAIEALIEAAIDFFPKARGRSAMKAALPRAMARMVEETNREVETRLSRFLQSAGNSPDSSESIPAS